MKFNATYGIIAFASKFEGDGYIYSYTLAKVDFS